MVWYGPSAPVAINFLPKFLFKYNQTSVKQRKGKIMNVNPVSFSGTFLIPYSELKKFGPQSHQVMRQIGQETAKFADIKDMEQTKEGILVNIDDKKAKEYEAVIAKYGVNIVRASKPAIGDGGAKSYEYMVSKLYPDIKDEKVKEFNETPEGDHKNKLYLDVYNRFKQSQHAKEA